MDDFNFFLKVAKPMILNLPDAKDRGMAALWLKKLSELNSHSSEVTSDNIYVEYLKLLLLVLQGNRLTGIFEKTPPTGDLRELLMPGQRKATDMISLTKGRKISISGGKTMKNDNCRVITSIGGDMCEYVAVQEIPNFGIHGYYALSTEPLYNWSNPQSSALAEAKTSSACFKNTCESLGVNDPDTDRDENVENSEKRRNNESTITDTRAEAGGSNVDEATKKKHEKTRHSENSLRKIFQAQRSEIAGVETRPCWGRSRYIDRLIDESPHHVGDIDLSEADALLHLYRDRKLRKIKKTDKGNQSKACAISSRRRQVETRLDMPPCASIPIDDFNRDEDTSDIEGTRTCIPRNLDLDGGSIIEEDKTCDCYISENEDYYPTNPIGSATSINLQDYDVLGYNSMDEQCESELIERTDYNDWRKYAYESEVHVDEPTRMTNENVSHLSNPTMTTNDTDDFREMRLLVADPYRREPPSRVKIKAPRRNFNVPNIGRTDVLIEGWNPPGHSTTMKH